MDFFNDIFHNLALLEFYFLNIIYILLYIDFILSIFFQHSNILTRASHHWCLASNIVLVHMCYTGMYCTAICHITQKVSISVANGWWNYEKKVNVACCYRSCDVINQFTWNKNCVRVSTKNSWCLSGHWPIWENTWGSIVDFNICRLQNSQIWLTQNLQF